MNFRVEYVRPRSDHCLCCEAAERATKSREVDLSPLKGFHLCFAPKMRSGVTGNWSDDIWMAEIIDSIQTKTIVCVCVSPAWKEQTKCVYSVLKWLRTKILNDNWRYWVAKTRPKLVWILNWSPERRYISSGVAKVHFWQQTRNNKRALFVASDDPLRPPAPYTMTFSQRKM